MEHKELLPTRQHLGGPSNTFIMTLQFSILIVIIYLFLECSLLTRYSIIGQPFIFFYHLLLNSMWPKDSTKAKTCMGRHKKDEPSINAKQDPTVPFVRSSIKLLTPLDLKFATEIFRKLICPKFSTTVPHHYIVINTFVFEKKKLFMTGPGVLWTFCLYNFLLQKWNDWKAIIFDLKKKSNY